MEMVEHYWELDERMEQYINKWKFELVDMGFYIKLHCPEYPDEPVQPDDIDVMDIETEYRSEEYDPDNLIFRKDFAHRDKKEVIVANYCHHSAPWSMLSDDHQAEIIQRTKENMSNAKLALTDPHKARKKSMRKVSRTPKRWTIDDSQRDW